MWQVIGLALGRSYTRQLRANRVGSDILNLLKAVLLFANDICSCCIHHDLATVHIIGKLPMLFACRFLLLGWLSAVGLVLLRGSLVLLINYRVVGQFLCFISEFAHSTIGLLDTVASRRLL